MAVGMMSCQAVRIVNTESAEDFVLADYRTYNFYEIEASGDTTTLIFRERIDLLKKEIAKQLEKRGLTRSTSEPDLLVNLGTVVDEKVQTRQTNIISDPPTYIGQRRYTWKSKEVEVGRYKAGTVSVDLVDREQNKLVWQGVAEGIIPNNPARLQKMIAKGAEKLFSRLPADAK